MAENIVINLSLHTDSKDGDKAIAAFNRLVVSSDKTDKTLKELTRTSAGLDKEFRTTTKDTEVMGRSFDETRKKADDLFESFKLGIGIDLGRNFLNLIGRAPAAMQNFVQRGIEFNSTLESAKVGIAAVFQQFNPDKYKSFPEAMAASTNAIKLLKEEARTSPATFKELVEAFQSTSGAMGAAGIKMENQVKLISLMSQTLSGLGIRSEQITQESRALITGNINANAAAARILGITRDDITKAKEAGQLYEFLNSKMASFATAADVARNSHQTMLSNLDDTLDEIAGKLTQDAFDAKKNGIATITQALQNIPEGTIKRLGEDIATLVRHGVSLVEIGVENANVLLMLGKSLAAVGAVFAGKKIITGFIELVRNISLVSAGIVKNTTALTAETAALNTNTAAQRANAASRTAMGGVIPSAATGGDWAAARGAHEGRAAAAQAWRNNPSPYVMLDKPVSMADQAARSARLASGGKIMGDPPVPSRAWVSSMASLSGPIIMGLFAAANWGVGKWQASEEKKQSDLQTLSANLGKEMTQIQERNRSATTQEALDKRKTEMEGMIQNMSLRAEKAGSKEEKQMFLDQKKFYEYVLHSMKKEGDEWIKNNIERMKAKELEEQRVKAEEEAEKERVKSDAQAKERREKVEKDATKLEKLRENELSLTQRRRAADVALLEVQKELVEAREEYSKKGDQSSQDQVAILETQMLEAKAKAIELGKQELEIREKNRQLFADMVTSYAEIAGYDDKEVRALKEQETIRRRILDLMKQGYDQSVSEKIAATEADARRISKEKKQAEDRAVYDAEMRAKEFRAAGDKKAAERQEGILEVWKKTREYMQKFNVDQKEAFAMVMNERRVNAALEADKNKKGSAKDREKDRVQSLKQWRRDQSNRAMDGMFYTAGETKEEREARIWGRTPPPSRTPAAKTPYMPTMTDFTQFDSNYRSIVNSTVAQNERDYRNSRNPDGTPAVTGNISKALESGADEVVESLKKLMDFNLDQYQKIKKTLDEHSGQIKNLRNN